MKRKKGYSLVIVVIIMSVVFLMAAFMVKAAYKSYSMTKDSYEDAQAYYAADAGVNYALDSICSENDNEDWWEWFIGYDPEQLINQIPDPQLGTNKAHINYVVKNYDYNFLPFYITWIDFDSIGTFGSSSYDIHITAEINGGYFYESYCTVTSRTVTKLK